MEQNLPEKYRYRNEGKSDDKIVYTDFQGWPEYRQTIRDALIGFGLSYNDGKWEMDDNDPRLDIDIRVLHDDGMGYGVNEEYVTSIDTFESEGKYFCNIFIEEDIEHSEKNE